MSVTCSMNWRQNKHIQNHNPYQSSVKVNSKVLSAEPNPLSSSN